MADKVLCTRDGIWGELMTQPQCKDACQIMYLQTSLRLTCPSHRTAVLGKQGSVCHLPRTLILGEAQGCFSTFSRTDLWMSDRLRSNPSLTASRLCGFGQVNKNTYCNFISLSIKWANGRTSTSKIMSCSFTQQQKADIWASLVAQQ